MGTVGLALVAAALLVGVSTQRVIGFGFALVSGPLFVLILGPTLSVQMVQVLGLFISGSILVSMWRWVEWRRIPWLLIPGVVGVLPGTWLANRLETWALETLIGVFIVVALLATVLSDRAKVFKGRGGAAAAGFLSGFMNTTAAVGGPAMALYKISTGWEQKPFVATIQVFFIGLNAAVLLARGWPDLLVHEWTVLGVVVVFGLWLGNLLAGRLPEPVVRRLVIVLSLAGGVATIIKGLSGM